MGQCVTSKYRESDKREGGSYAFERLSRYFDVTHWTFCAAPLKVEQHQQQQGPSGTAVVRLGGNAEHGQDLLYVVEKLTLSFKNIKTIQMNDIILWTWSHSLCTFADSLCETGQ